ncbi:MAG: HesA/MoeB/ThiF family protein [Magnetococcus sp. DMHC-1]|nr:HesA/MoeB/ThiF family protein [Magnetococcales bacterium]
MNFTEAQLDRYSRQIMLREVGGSGQARLLAAEMVLLGVGAMGSVAALYLAGAGVGHLTLIDAGHVTPATPARDIIHTRQHLGTPKVVSAAQALQALNPDVRTTPIVTNLTGAVSVSLPEICHLVLDCGNHADTSHLLEKLCRQRNIPLIVARWNPRQGEIYQIRPGGPCLACMTQSLADSGYFSSGETDTVAAQADALDHAAPGSILAGLVASVAATESIKTLLSVAAPVTHSCLVFNARSGAWDNSITVSRSSCC